MKITDANMAACQEALYLLRQDVELPGVAEADADASLEWRKCRTAFAAAAAEVWGAHDWGASLGLSPEAAAEAAGDAAAWTPAMRAALVHCLAAELAVPLAGRVQDLQNARALYAERLARARVEALWAERGRIADATHREVLALVVPRLDPADDHLPRSLRSVTDRADELAETARRAVLDAHAWNFARTEEEAPPCLRPAGRGAYPFTIPLPAGCVHVEAVRTPDGALADWRVTDGGEVASRDPVASVVYVRDDRRPGRWPAAVRRAYVLRLAADVSQTEAPQLLQVLEAKAAEALEEAKTRDARENHAPRDAWGRNHAVDAMRGAVPTGDGGPRRRPFDPFGRW